MKPQPFNSEFDAFFMKVYPNHSTIASSQRQLLKTFFYVGGMLFKNSASAAGDDDISEEQNTRVLADIQIHLQRFGRQLNRTSTPPIKGKLGTVFNTFLSKDITPSPPLGSPRNACYAAFVAGIMAMLDILTSMANSPSDDIAISRIDLIHEDLMNNTGIEAWHVPTWPMEE